MSLPHDIDIQVLQRLKSTLQLAHEGEWEKSRPAEGNFPANMRIIGFTEGSKPRGQINAGVVKDASDSPEAALAVDHYTKAVWLERPHVDAALSDRELLRDVMRRPAKDRIEDDKTGIGHTTEANPTTPAYDAKPVFAEIAQRAGLEFIDGKKKPSPGAPVMVFSEVKPYAFAAGIGEPNQGDLLFSSRASFADDTETREKLLKAIDDMLKERIKPNRAIEEARARPRPGDDVRESLMQYIAKQNAGGTSGGTPGGSASRN